jgi:hypothetical protein
LEADLEECQEERDVAVEAMQKLRQWTEDAKADQQKSKASGDIEKVKLERQVKRLQKDMKDVRG